MSDFICKKTIKRTLGGKGLKRFTYVSINQIFTFLGRDRNEVVLKEHCGRMIYISDDEFRNNFVSAI